MGLEYNDEQGVYTYNVTQLLPLEFDKVEMDEFIKKERKIIDVSVDISIVTKGENIGFFIDGKNNFIEMLNSNRLFINQTVVNKVAFLDSYLGEVITLAMDKSNTYYIYRRWM